MQERIIQLQNQIKELQDWFNRDQQIEYPIDFTSKKIIQKNLLIATGNTSGSGSFITVLEVSIDRQAFWLQAQAL